MIQILKSSVFSFLVSDNLFLVVLLCQALAQLYVIDGQYEKAFSLYADVSGLGISCTCDLRT